jgi:hypothetical protein
MVFDLVYGPATGRFLAHYAAAGATDLRGLSFHVKAFIKRYSLSCRSGSLSLGPHRYEIIPENNYTGPPSPFIKVKMGVFTVACKELK